MTSVMMITTAVAVEVGKNEDGKGNATSRSCKEREKEPPRLCRPRCSAPLHLRLVKRRQTTGLDATFFPLSEDAYSDFSPDGMLHAGRAFLRVSVPRAA